MGNCIGDNSCMYLEVVVHFAGVIVLGQAEKELRG